MTMSVWYLKYETVPVRDHACSVLFHILARFYRLRFTYDSGYNFFSFQRVTMNYHENRKILCCYFRRQIFIKCRANCEHFEASNVLLRLYSKGPLTRAILRATS
jgi:hypothetical protein